uniref:Tetratricopeptide repeat protein 17 n=2 Tax=Parascaris univalens TaxID=6257 RepID=A0A914ZLD2_PARUN
HYPLFKASQMVKGLFVLITALSFGIALSSGFTHWMVTEDGLSIQSVSDSPFLMAQPHSLVQFLDQERKLDAISQNRELFSEHEKMIREQEKIDDPEIESKIRSSDEDCLAAGTFSTNRDPFIVSYTLVDPLEDLEYMIGIVKDLNEDIPRENPYCTSDLPFSMYAFEHLPSMQQRAGLSIPYEHELQKSLPSRFRLLDFGHYVAVALEKEPTSAPLLNLAALYWRIRGEASNAVECLRRSLHYSTQQKRAGVMFALGNMLHRAGHSLDAIVLYQLVLAEIDDAFVHMALADALVVVQNRSDAIVEYDAAFARDPKMSDASLKAAALRCDQKLVDAMEKQHKNLLDTISEKNLYNNRYELVKTLEENVRKNVLDADGKLQSTLIYEYFTYGTLPHVSCRTVKHSGRSAMQCTISDWRRYRAAVSEKHQKLITAARRNAPQFSNETFDLSGDEEEEESQELIEFLNALDPFKGIDMDEPNGRPIYPRKIESSMSRLLERYLSNSWPNRSLCDANRWRHPMPTADNLPQLFMSPDNKGYSVSDLLNKYLGLSPLKEHPLPWALPECGSFIRDQPLSSMFKLPGVVHASSRGRSVKFAEERLRQTFVNLVGNRATQADVAQRIRTLLKYNIGPKWLVFNLAALYWRIAGVPGEAISCLRAALFFQPERHADVALTQLAQIVMRTASRDEHLSDASALLNTAIHVDPNEPLTYFLNGLIQILQKKYSIALAHVRAAVILDPLFQPAVDVLHALKCAASKDGGNPVGERIQARCCSPSQPNVLCFVSLGGACFTARKHGVYEANNCDINNRQSKDVCWRATPLVPFIAPSLSYDTSDAGNLENVESLKNRQDTNTDGLDDWIDNSDEIALDFGAEQCLQRIRERSRITTTPMSQTQVLYAGAKRVMTKEAEEVWEEEVTVHIVPFPESPLSLSQISDRRQMLAYDIELPEVLPLPLKEQIRLGLQYLPPSRTSDPNFCNNMKMTISMLHEQTTSTWVSVTAKGVGLEQYMDLSNPAPAIAGFEPNCPDLDEPSPLRTFDHLPAYHLREQFIFYKPEKALTDAFQSLGNERERIEHVAGRLMIAMKVSKLTPNLSKNQDGGVHWTLSTASTLFWRVKGDAVNALKCLRHSLNNAPPDMKDVALVSMANIYHQAGLLHSALIAGGAALGISPKLVAIHFTLANIYASMADYEHALQFYYSTLSLQSTFEPAKERIRAIYCHTGSTFRFHSRIHLR